MNTFGVNSHLKNLIAFTIVNQSQVKNQNLEIHPPFNPANRKTPNEEQWRPYSHNPRFNQQKNQETSRFFSTFPQHLSTLWYFLGFCQQDKTSPPLVSRGFVNRTKPQEIPLDQLAFYQLELDCRKQIKKQSNTPIPHSIYRDITIKQQKVVPIPLLRCRARNRIHRLSFKLTEAERFTLFFFQLLHFVLDCSTVESKGISIIKKKKKTFASYITSCVIFIFN